MSFKTIFWITFAITYIGISVCAIRSNLWGVPDEGAIFPAFFIMIPICAALCSGVVVWIASGVKEVQDKVSRTQAERVRREQEEQKRLEQEKAEIITMIDKALEEKEGDNLEEEQKRFIQEDIEYVQKEIEELQRDHEKWRGLLTSEDQEVKRLAQEEEGFIKEQIEFLNEHLEELRLSLTSQEEEGKEKRR